MGYIQELRALVGHRPLLFVGAVTIISNDAGHILLQQRKFPHGVWGLPGGLMELGESTEQVAMREVTEECGLTITNLQLLNVYSGPEHFIKAANGDEFYVVTIAYYTNDFTGEVRINDDESLAFKWFKKDELPQTIAKSHRTILNDFFNQARL